MKITFRVARIEPRQDGSIRVAASPASSEQYRGSVIALVIKDKLEQAKFAMLSEFAVDIAEPKLRVKSKRR